MKVVYMSGFTDAALVQQIISLGGKLVEKPLSPLLLLRAVREALDS